MIWVTHQRPSGSTVPTASGISALHRRRSHLRGLSASVVMAAVFSLCAGCAEEAINFIEVKRTSETISRAEWASFSRIVEGMGNPYLTTLPSVYPPLPNWHESRSLPVNDLASEEAGLVEQAWDVAHWRPLLERHRQLNRLLQRERMTLDQFIGLTLAIGAAVSRSQLDSIQPLQKFEKQALDHVDSLRRDTRLFNALGSDGRIRVLEQAIWIHRDHRSRRLLEVPEDNVKLARQQATWLAQVLPPCFLVSPLADIVDVLEEFGTPFIELPETGTDDAIEWEAAAERKIRL
jgi:hypothetical protein